MHFSFPYVRAKGIVELSVRLAWFSEGCSGIEGHSWDVSNGLIFGGGFLDVLNLTNAGS